MEMMKPRMEETVAINIESETVNNIVESESSAINDGNKSETSNVNNGITKQDFLDFQNSINISFNKIHQQIDVELGDLNKKIQCLPNLVKVIDTLKLDNDKLKTDISTLKGDLFISTEKNKEDEKKINFLQKEINNLKRNVNENMKDIRNSISNIPRIEVVNDSTEEVKKLEERISVLEQHPKVSKQKSNTSEETLSSQFPDNVNADCLILGDSNTRYINCDLLSKKFGKTAKFYCPTLEDVSAFCKNATCVTTPSKILIHCGTNDFDKHKNDPLKIVDEIEKVVDIVKSKFKKSTIIFSTILPRKDNSMDESAIIVNDFIKSLMNKGILVMNNNRISKKNLFDNKHLNKSGFFTFLANIKFVLYGEVPFTNRHHQNNKRGNSSRVFGHRSSS